MLRCALFFAVLGFLATTSISSAQQPASSNAPAIPPAASAPSSGSDSMEEVQLGDHWTYELKDEITGDVKATLTNVVTDVTDAEISTRTGSTGNNNTGYITFDRSWNVKNNPTWRFSPNDGSGVRMPLAVGKTWTVKGTEVNISGGFSSRRSGTAKVLAQETVTTRAGTFETFKIEMTQTIANTNDPTKKYQLTVQMWYAPSINHWVKRSSVSRLEGHVRDRSEIELVEYGRR